MPWYNGRFFVSAKEIPTGAVPVETELDENSHYPIANKAVAKAIGIMGDLTMAEEYVPSKNLCNPVNPNKQVNWYDPADGKLSESSQYDTCDFFEVTPGTAYTISRYGDENTPGELLTAPRIAYYSERNEDSFTHGEQNKCPFTPREGDRFARVSWRNTANSQPVINVQIEEGTEPTAYEPFKAPDANAGEDSFKLHRECLPEDVAEVPERVDAVEEELEDLKKNGQANLAPIGYFRASGDLADGEELTLPENNVKCNTVTVFSCHLGVLDKVYIGKKTTGNEKPCICIDNTNVTVTPTLNPSEANMVFEHGLTFGANLLVRIETDETKFASRITITSGESTFEVTEQSKIIQWTGDTGSTFARSEGSTLSNCVLSWTNRNITKPVWVFGDSYVSHTYPQRWTYHLLADGYGDTMMLNGYAGENSAAALVGLKNLLTIGRPQYIVWALGMNDKDGTDSVNASWQSCFEEVEALCDMMNIKLIACTIPQTTATSTNNTYKNAIIRASGHRYIDFEEAVVVDTSTGTWYEGLLATDEVHPSTAGAKALYYRLLCDFPEIMTL